ncbi:MAG: chromate efflux transporter [Alphaproteobacteria bacterium]|nr:chromate efflux transporter [Alphaproteobacteria bacterium]
MTTPAHGISFATALRAWWAIGLNSFGGPAGQIAVMHRMLVEERHWIGEARFLHALNYCMLLPGPEAQQLATYVGWLLHRWPGGLVAGGLFVLPGAVLMLALAMIYASFGQIAWLAGLFWGLSAAVLTLVLEALSRIAKRALKGGVAWSIAGLAFLGIYFLGLPFPAIVAAAALTGAIGVRFAPEAFAGGGHGSAKDDRPAAIDAMFANGPPDHVRANAGRALTTAVLWVGLWLAPVAALYILRGADDVFTRIGLFFAKMAVVTFGGAYAVLAYVAQEAVEAQAWLSAEQMLHGLGLAETTPGPLILVLEFVGFLAAYYKAGGLDPLWAGTLGAALTIWVTFVPSFLWIFVGAPYVEELRRNRALAAALSAITAAVVGVVLNLALWFAQHSLFARQVKVGGYGLSFERPEWSTLDPWLAGLTAIALLAGFRFKLGTTKLLLGAALAGIALRTLVL